MTGNEATQAKKSLKDLKKNIEVNGTVINVGLSGALVDVGAEKPGLLHISALGKDKVNRIQDVLQTGQSVRAWVRKVDAEKGELQLTMVEPLALEWGDIKTGSTVHGKVVRVEQFGVFVDFGAERPGMIHISELSTEYVKDVASVAKVGDEIDALIVEVNRQKRQIRLVERRWKPRRWQPRPQSKKRKNPKKRPLPQWKRPSCGLSPGKTNPRPPPMPAKSGKPGNCAWRRKKSCGARSKLRPRNNQKKTAEFPPVFFL